MKKLLILFAAISLSACSALSPQKPHNIQSDAIGTAGNLYTIPANLRVLDVRKKDADYIVCSEPAPDIAMSNALKLALDATDTQSANASTTTGDDSTSGSVSNALGLKGSSDASTTALELAGRTQIVLLAREFISSNCKARANGWITDADFKAYQMKIVDQISDMINTDNEKAKAEKAKAEAVGAVVKAELDKKAIANVTTVFDQAKLETCLISYDDCILSSENNSTKVKACKSTFAKCSN